MRKLLLLLTSVFLLAGCLRANPFTEDEKRNVESDTETVIADGTTEPAATQDANEQTEPAETLEETETLPEADPASIDLSHEPSEGGRIMILMYHNIGPEEEEWTRTPDKFREDLQILYDKGYRPIKLTDYARGHIDVPAGMTPYVITFDDARENNFRYLEDGRIDPDCAVGVLMDFAETHEGFFPHASFFVNGDIPFRVEGEEEQKVAFLLENGMDIGNHTVGHEDFSDLTAEELQETIGRQAAYLDSLTPDDYEINTIALPFGSRPDDDSLTPYLKDGSYDGFSYHHIAILNVGWDPAYSPFHTKFDAEYIPRIRASEMHVDEVGIRNWIDYFDNNPEERYISDGDPRIVSAPADWEEVMQVPEGLVLNLYEWAE